MATRQAAKACVVAVLRLPSTMSATKMDLWMHTQGDPYRLHAAHVRVQWSANPACVWCGVVWRGVVWCGGVWCGVVRDGVVRCGRVWYGGVWYGMVRFGMVWHGVV